APARFPNLKHQQLLLTGKDISIDPGKEGLLLTWSKAIEFLPTPDQLRQGKRQPQRIDEGVSLRAQVQISADRRFVRATFTEKSLEIDGSEQLNVLVDEKGTEVPGEIVFLKKASLSQVRDIPDGGALLLPLQYQPRALRDKGQWLAAEIDTRIYIEEE